MPLKSVYESNLKLKYDSEIIFISCIPSSEYVCSLPLIIFAITLRSNCRFRVVGKVVISYYCVEYYFKCEYLSFERYLILESVILRMKIVNRIKNNFNSEIKYYLFKFNFGSLGHSW